MPSLIRSKRGKEPTDSSLKNKNKPAFNATSCLQSVSWDSLLKDGELAQRKKGWERETGH